MLLLHFSLKVWLPITKCTNNLYTKKKKKKKND